MFLKFIHAILSFVFRSQYFDEDGDLAHKFYEETVDHVTKQVIMKEKTNVTPQVRQTTGVRGTFCLL